MATDMDTGGWVSAKERHAMNREKGIATKLNRFDFFFLSTSEFLSIRILHRTRSLSSRYVYMSDENSLRVNAVVGEFSLLVALC